LGEWISYQL